MCLESANGHWALAYSIETVVPDPMDVRPDTPCLVGALVDPQFDALSTWKAYEKLVLAVVDAAHDCGRRPWAFGEVGTTHVRNHLWPELQLELMDAGYATD